MARSSQRDERYLRRFFERLSCPLAGSRDRLRPTMPEATAAEAKPAPSKKVIFLRRLVSSVILWTIVIASLFSGNKILSDYVFLAIMMTLAGFGLIEFY